MATTTKKIGSTQSKSTASSSKAAKSSAVAKGNSYALKAWKATYASKHAKGSSNGKAH